MRPFPRGVSFGHVGPATRAAFPRGDPANLSGRHARAPPHAYPDGIRYGHMCAMTPFPERLSQSRRTKTSMDSISDSGAPRAMRSRRPQSTFLIRDQLSVGKRADPGKPCLMNGRHSPGQNGGYERTVHILQNCQLNRSYVATRQQGGQNDAKAPRCPGNQSPRHANRCGSRQRGR